VLYTKVGTTGVAKAIDTNREFSIFVSVALLKLTPAVLPQFLEKVLNSPVCRAQAADLTQGMANRNLVLQDLKRIRVPIPPVREQERIAAILNEQMAAVERARAAAEAQLEAAKALPAAYLRAVFFSPSALRWARRTLHEVSKLLASKSIATDGDVEVQAITTACLSEGGFLIDGIKTARMWSRDVAECTLARGEVLIARSNTAELVGRVAMFLGEPIGAVASDLTIRIRPTHDITAEFLTAYLSFLYQTGYWKERAGGASGSMKKITREQIQAQHIPVPDIDVQRRIALKLKEEMVSAKRGRMAIEEELVAINRLPAALLRRAFAGEL